MLIVVVPLKVVLPEPLSLAAPVLSKVKVLLKIAPLNKTETALPEIETPKVVEPNVQVPPETMLKVPLFTLPPLKVGVPESVSVNVFRSKVPSDTVKLLMLSAAFNIGWDIPPPLMITLSPSPGDPLLGSQFMGLSQAEVTPFQV